MSKASGRWTRAVGFDEDLSQDNQPPWLHQALNKQHSSVWMEERQRTVKQRWQTVDATDAAKPSRFRQSQQRSSLSQSLSESITNRNKLTPKIPIKTQQQSYSTCSQRKSSTKQVLAAALEAKNPDAAWEIFQSYLQIDPDSLCPVLSSQFYWEQSRTAAIDEGAPEANDPNRDLLMKLFLLEYNHFRLDPVVYGNRLIIIQSILNRLGRESVDLNQVCENPQLLRHLCLIPIYFELKRIEQVIHLYQLLSKEGHQGLVVYLFYDILVQVYSSLGHMDVVDHVNTIKSTFQPSNELHSYYLSRIQSHPIDKSRSRDPITFIDSLVSVDVDKFPIMFKEAQANTRHGHYIAGAFLALAIAKSDLTSQRQAQHMMVQHDIRLKESPLVILAMIRMFSLLGEFDLVMQTFKELSSRSDFFSPTSTDKVGISTVETLSQAYDQMVQALVQFKKPIHMLEKVVHDAEKMHVPLPHDTLVKMMERYRQERQYSKLIHLYNRLALKQHFKPTVYTYNLLLKSYFDLGGGWLKEMRRVYWNMILDYHIAPNSKLLNTMIGCLAMENSIKSGLQVLNKDMKIWGLKPNRFTFTSLIHAVILERNLEYAIHLFRTMVDKETLPDTEAMNMMLNGVLSFGELDMAKDIMKYMEMNRDTEMDFDDQSIIAKLGLTRFHPKKYGIEPNSKTFGMLLKHKRFIKDFSGAEGIFASMKRYGIKPNLIVYSTLLDMYAKSRDIHSMQDVLQQMKQSGVALDIYAYSIVMRAYLRVGQPQKVLTAFETLLAEGLQPDTHIYDVVVRALLRSNNMKAALEVVKDMNSSPTHPPEQGLVIHTHGQRRNTPKSDPLASPQARKFIDVVDFQKKKISINVYGQFISFWSVRNSMEAAIALLQHMEKQGISLHPNGYYQFLRGLTLRGHSSAVGFLFRLLLNGGNVPSKMRSRLLQMLVMRRDVRGMVESLNILLAYRYLGYGYQTDLGFLKSLVIEIGKECLEPLDNNSAEHERRLKYIESYDIYERKNVTTDDDENLETNENDVYIAEEIQNKQEETEEPESEPAPPKQTDPVLAMFAGERGVNIFDTPYFQEMYGKESAQEELQAFAPKSETEDDLPDLDATLFDKHALEDETQSLSPSKRIEWLFDQLAFHIPLRIYLTPSLMAHMLLTANQSGEDGFETELSMWNKLIFELPKEEQNALCLFDEGYRFASESRLDIQGLFEEEFKLTRSPSFQSYVQSKAVFDPEQDLKSAPGFKWRGKRIRQRKVLKLSSIRPVIPMSETRTEKVKVEELITLEDGHDLPPFGPLLPPNLLLFSTHLRILFQRKAWDQIVETACNQVYHVFVAPFSTDQEPTPTTCSNHQGIVQKMRVGEKYTKQQVYTFLKSIEHRLKCERQQEHARRVDEFWRLTKRIEII